MAPTPQPVAKVQNAPNNKIESNFFIFQSLIVKSAFANEAKGFIIHGILSDLIGKFYECCRIPHQNIEQVWQKLKKR